MSDDRRGLRFGTVAEEYDKFRPDPPEAASSLVGDLSGRDVLEVAAGTGKLTRFLLGLGAQLTVIEPDDDMRKVLLRHSPGVRVVVGTAESVPEPDASFDAVFSSSAWHWFRQPDATNELGRVLRDNGVINVWWNSFDTEVPWMGELALLRERPGDESIRDRSHRAMFDPAGPFVDVEDFLLEWTWTRSIDDVVGNFGTYSGAIIRSDEERRHLAQRVREALTERFENGVVELPMALRGTTARRRPR
jgi:SAM-dependent methyltransferase